MSHTRPIQSFDLDVRYQHQQRLFIYTVLDTAPWLDDILPRLATWPPQQPFMMIVDFSAMPFNSVILDALEQLAAAIPKTLCGRLAVILNPMVNEDMLGALKDQFGSGRLLTLERKFFDSREKGSAWVEKAL